MGMIILPKKFEEKIKLKTINYSVVLDTISTFEELLSDDNLFFFPEYTNHGIKHINSVLKYSAELIPDDTLVLLSSDDITVLFLSVILHDLGMQCEYSSLKFILNGFYDDIFQSEEIFGGIFWRTKWDQYLQEIKKYNSKQNNQMFGTDHLIHKDILSENVDNLTGLDRKIIGEFLRRNHPKLSHEIALKGLVANNGVIIPFAAKLDYHYRQLVGIIARSHGMHIRDTFDYLKEIEVSDKNWKTPYNVNAIYLMVVLRIADYFQIDATRIDKINLKFRTFLTPISILEFEKHLSIDDIQTYQEDPETLFIKAKPKNSFLYIALLELFKDIQKELDTSWAILGEIYGNFEKQPKIKYRRIISNIEEKKFLKGLEYIPEKIMFVSDTELPKLLVGPLYGNNPTFAVRELELLQR